MALAAILEARCRCGAPMREDRQLAADAQRFTPGLLIQQFRCWNGHAVTINPILRLRPPTVPVTCDVCDTVFLARAERTPVRHPACQAEHDRRRMRKDAERLTARVKVHCNGR